MDYFGDPGQGHTLAQTALRLHQQSTDYIGAAMSLMQIGSMHFYSGELQSAADRFGECAHVSEASGNLWYQTYAQWGLGLTAWLLADHSAATDLVSSALGLRRDMDDRIGVALCLDALAWIAASQQNAARAATLLGAADAAWAAIPAVLPPALGVHHNAALGAAREVLPESASTAAYAKGSAMGQAEAIAFALSEPSRPASRTGGTQAGVSPGQQSRGTTARSTIDRPYPVVPTLSLTVRW
jgi:hypothetical protein